MMLVGHYGMDACERNGVIAVRPHEERGGESPERHLKFPINQALILRGKPATSICVKTTGAFVDMLVCQAQTSNGWLPFCRKDAF